VEGGVSGDVPVAPRASSLLVTLFALVVVRLLSARLSALRSPALHARLRRRVSWKGAIPAVAAWRVSQEGGAR
jgi:hypothetical protein